jgi:hypothetical protein
MLDPKIEEFVRSRTANVKHSGRTFFEHLIGVYNLLEEEGEPDYVCLAGLCHSIYGTNAFKQQVALLTERNEIVRIIGGNAEWLAFLFCSCSRPSALIEAVIAGPPYYVISRHTEEKIYLSVDTLRDLLKIEAANLKEQKSVKMLPAVEEALGFLH